jgi:iron(III) transport system substrate-binding protein
MSARSRLFTLAASAALFLCGCGDRSPRVVLYCAQDEEFASGLLEDFQARGGLPVDVKYDTEKDKSVSLYRELLHERPRPRCDVFWNNEVLATILLARQGLLEPYDSPSRAGFPPWARDAGAWTAFAQRARVLVVNTDLVKEEDRPRSLLELTAPRWRGRVTMAKPLHGTALTQAVCLFEVLGTDRAQQYYRGLKANGVKVAPGNKQAAEWVGSGAAAVGVTDTDDAIAEVEAGRPVAIVFPDADRPATARMGTLFIPNTLAIVRGGPNPDGARRLVDFLLSAEVESRLASSGSRQFPVNPGVKVELPRALARATKARPMRLSWDAAADLWRDAQRFLREEFAGGD